MRNNPRRFNKKQNGQITLPNEIWSLICTELSPFDLLNLRRVNRQLNELVTDKLKALFYLDLLRCDTEQLSNDEYEDEDFHQLKKTNIYMHLDERSAVVMVDDRWTSKDVYTLWEAIQFFAPFVRCLTIDVALAELIVAALSSVKLSRWYAFQCYVDTVGQHGVEELHMKCNKQTNHKRVLFPQMTEFTLRAMPSDLAHLSRLSDYGVQKEAIFSNECIQLVRCTLLEPTGTKMPGEKTICTRFGAKRPHQHLRAFKQWIGAENLKEKYMQQYST
ncbi:unnamed protein product [Bursaphelenchus xylophilus]|uniref:(pine wood nematode) hypothetical protein n=1 Tax=Bursaphelenchus xylophilus TaxID=6326 RepID=A0A1I7RSY4_BURXY|nr:unnamed protein product [Bursaphelenchus xylophilus]CAG9122735.1 unnamed protein product [Bursaphelenchus xylophilus]